MNQPDRSRYARDSYTEDHRAQGLPDRDMPDRDVRGRDVDGRDPADSGYRSAGAAAARPAPAPDGGGGYARPRGSRRGDQIIQQSAPTSDGGYPDAPAPGARATEVHSAAGERGTSGATEPGAQQHQSVEVMAVERCRDFRSRWDSLQGTFVDRPREAVQEADGLVGDVLDELSRVFRDQRGALEAQWANDTASTENLRVALHRYRDFFDRLLTL